MSSPKKSSAIIGQIPYWMLVIGSCVQALTCLEKKENGDMIETASDKFTYCVVSPDHMDGKNFVEGKSFAVGPENDPTGVYDKVFNLSAKTYQILTFCIYERYDFSKMSSRLAFKEPEFMLRCFCNFDNCNYDNNFFGYLDNLKTV